MDNKRLIVAWGYGHPSDLIKVNRALLRQHIVRVQPVKIAIAEHKDSWVWPVFAVEFGDMAGEGSSGVTTKVLISCHLFRIGA